MSLRLPPTFIPLTPSSHPLITSPAPSLNENGSPRSTDESNFFPSLNCSGFASRLFTEISDVIDNKSTKRCFVAPNSSLISAIFFASPSFSWR